MGRQNTDKMIKGLAVRTAGKPIANTGTAMIREATKEFFHLKSYTTLARIRLSDWSAPMALSGNRLEDGMAGRISFARYGSGQK